MATEDEPCLPVAEVVKDKRPRPVDPCAEPLPPPWWQVIFGVQHEVTARLKLGDGEGAAGGRGSVGDEVAYPAIMAWADSRCGTAVGGCQLP